MRLLIGIAALAVLAAGCGSSSPAPSGATSAAIPASVADRLAAQSEAVAATLDAGDVCGAAQKADDLRHAVDAAVANGSVPAAYRDDLEQAVTNLQDTVNCEPPPGKPHPQGPPPKKDHPGKGKGHDKHDSPPPADTTTAGTTTAATTSGTTTDGTTTKTKTAGTTTGTTTGVTG